MAVNFKADDFKPGAAAKAGFKMTDRTAEAKGGAFQFVGGVRPPPAAVNPTNPYLRFAVLPGGGLLDFEPMKEDKPPAIFDSVDRTWKPFEGTLGELRDASPVTTEEAERLTGQHRE